MSPHSRGGRTSGEMEDVAVAGGLSDIVSIASSSSDSATSPGGGRTSDGMDDVVTEEGLSDAGLLGKAVSRSWGDSTGEVDRVSLSSLLGGVNGGRMRPPLGEGREKISNDMRDDMVGTVVCWSR